MDDNEFKLDFDFEKEYGFDPDDFLASDGEDFDYSEFLKEDEPEQPVIAQSDEQPAEAGQAQYEVPEEQYTDESEAYPSENAEEYSEGYPEDYQEGYQDGYQEAEEFAEYDAEGESAEYDSSEEPADSGKKKKFGFNLGGGKIRLPKVSFAGLKSKLPGKKANSDSISDEEEMEALADKPVKKGAISRLVDIYMEPITSAAADGEVMDPLDPKYIRKKKKEKKRIFKEVYLPAIIACAALFLIISFIVGSISNALQIRANRQVQAQQQAEAQASAAGQAEVAFKNMMARVETMAIGYDYDGAISELDSFNATSSAHRQSIDEKRAALVKEQAALVEWKDYATIPNLSFHVLMADASRACDKNVSGDLAGSYNRNFVSVEEFSRILNQLYASNYVLVDFDSFVAAATGSDGNASFFSNPIKLPSGKKPIMITETMVNYFEYMVDPDKDGKADANGHGFANKLVVDSKGEIKASYVDASGQEHIGNYDLVPVLEAFIQEHPDFAYQGARAILAVTGSEGVFGYRTNTSYVASRGQSYYDDQVSQAKVLVEALRNKGYTIACYTYSNQAYKSMTTLQIQGEMTNWTNQITPVIGEVDTIVFARGSDIEAYSGTTFNVLYNTGFRFFLNSGSSPRVDINTTFVRQTRLMVTGEAMTWYSSQFSDYFDCNIVLDISGRGSQPTKS